MGLRFLLDTNAILYHLGGRLLEPLPARDTAVSVITEIELLSFPEITAQEEDNIRDLLSKLSILPLDAEAAARNLILVTYDSDLRRPGDVETIQPALREPG